MSVFSKPSYLRGFQYWFDRPNPHPMISRPGRELFTIEPLRQFHPRT